MTTDTATTTAGGRTLNEWLRFARPYVLIAICAAVGLVAGRIAPLFGAAAFAMVAGVLVRTLAPAAWSAGIRKGLGSRILQGSIVCLGLSVNLALIASVAADSLLVMVVTLVIGLGAILLIGRRLGIEAPMTALIAAGTAICGASAIAAVSPVVGASSRQVGRALAVIFAFNLTAVALFPAIAHAIGMTASHYAVWAGTAVNDTASVLAAAFAFGPETVPEATTVKLARSLMIIPVVLFFAFTAPRAENTAPVTWRKRLRLVPGFILLFVAGAALNTLSVVPAAVSSAAPQVAFYGTVVALATIGLGVDLRSFAGSGARPVLLGLVGWVVVAASSLALIGALSILARH